MKEVIVVMMCVLMASCQDVPTDKPMHNNARITMHDYGRVYNVNGIHAFRLIEIDGCQYIYDGSMHTSVMTHKGNCSNPIHEGGTYCVMIADTSTSIPVTTKTILHAISNK